MPADGQPRAGTRVLVVEDEVLVAMFIEDVLTEAGCQIVGIARRVADALDIIGSRDIDLALLDLNLDGKETYAIADELKRRAIPFIFCTGYGAIGVRADYRGHPALDKPFGDEQLRRAVAGALERIG